ncbi:MAG: hypothetical protein KAR00_02995 [Candidatus Pacebacteria bacterium]|nr:hypothetical protein [Candidatus Paceibacterota bacterium]
MKSLIFKKSFFLASILFFVFPLLVFSQEGIVPCDGLDCNFGSLLELGDSIVNFLVVISIPLAVIAFVYAGFLYLTAGGSENQIKKAHLVFWKVLWGFIIILSAWLIVHTILGALVKESYSYL